MGLTWFRRPIRGAAERPTRNAASGPSSTATSRKCAAPGTRTKKITSNSSGIKLDKEPTRRPIERRTREKKIRSRCVSPAASRRRRIRWRHSWVPGASGPWGPGHCATCRAPAPPDRHASPAHECDWTGFEVLPGYDVLLNKLGVSHLEQVSVGFTEVNRVLLSFSGSDWALWLSSAFWYERKLKIV